MSPIRVTSAKLGGPVEVISRFYGQQMSFPVAHPASAVCQVSRLRLHDGGAVVVFRTLARIRITFYSTYSRATTAMMPAMLGRVVVR